MCRVTQQATELFSSERSRFGEEKKKKKRNQWKGKMPQVYINGAYCGARRVGFGMIMTGRES